MSEIKYDIDNIDVVDIMQQIHNKNNNCELIFSSEIISLDELMKKLQRNIEKRIYKPEDIKSLGNFTIHKFETNIPQVDEFYSITQNLALTSAIKFWWPIPKSNNIKELLKALRYKITRKFMFFYMKFVMDQQNSFNSNVSIAITKLAEHNNNLKSENESLQKKVNDLEIQLNELKATSKKQTEALRKTLMKIQSNNN